MDLTGIASAEAAAGGPTLEALTQALLMCDAWFFSIKSWCQRLGEFLLYLKMVGLKFDVFTILIRWLVDDLA